MEQVMRYGAACVALTVCVAAPATALAKQTLTLADLRKTIGVVEPQISPDGKRIVVVFSRRDFEKDESVDDLTVIDVRTHAARTLVADSHATQFEWSPDAASIAYVAKPKSGEDKSPQLFVLSMNGGEPVQLTHEKEGVESFDWRPDGKALAYAYTPERKDQKAIDHKENGFDVTGEAWTAQEPYDKTELAEIDTAGGKPRSSLGHIDNVSGGLTYSADGRSIYVTRLAPGTDPSDVRNVIDRVDRATGAVSHVPNATSASDPLRSLDGKYLAHSSANPAFAPVTQIVVRNPSGHNVEWSTARFDRNVQSVAFMPDDSLVVTANDAASTKLFNVRASGARELPASGLVVRSSPSAARDGTIAFAAVAADRPAEVYVLRPNARAPERLSNKNGWVSRYAVGRHEEISWTSGGRNINGVLYYPPNYDALRRSGKRLPLVLYIHGGPTSASTTAFGMPDVFASHGWIVFSPNYPGSDNQGVGFADMIVPRVTSLAGPPILDGVAAVLKHTAADASRIGVSGWSAGGMMTSWLITHDTRWKAAVDGAAVDDFIGLGNMSDVKGYQYALIGSGEYADPARMKIYIDESPMTYVDRVKTPTLILSDAGDFRVPTPLSYAFYHGIRATGTPVKFVIWPVGGHFPSDPVRSEDVYRQWEAWFASRL